MDYNNQLNKLIENAKNHGYDYVNGEFINTQKFVPVVEIFLVNNSTYESSGYYQIFKKTYIITEEELKQVFEYAKQNNSKTVRWDCGCEDSIYEKVLDIIDKYDESEIDYIDINTGGFIDIRLDEYATYSESDEVADFFFSKENDNADFPRGFVSFYMMDYKDFLKSDNVNVDVTKFMKFN